MNDVISLKRQFIKQMVEVYFQQKTSREQLIAMHAASQLLDGAVYEYKADLRTIPVPRVPIEALLDHVYGKLSLTGRPLALASTLSGALTHLENLMFKRSEMILEFKRLTDERRRSEFIALYFGDVHEDGHINEEYVDVMKGLQLMSDDAIFFSHLLCQDLIEQGNIILVEFKKQFDEVIEKVNSIQLRPEKTEGIMPSSNEYADWLSGFPKPQ